MTGKELAEKCAQVAREYKTLYVLGCIGAPLHAANKQRYTNNLAFNRNSARAEKINAATADTFGFDCVCLIKSLLWGWSGDTGAIYGGAKYASAGVPDIGANAMIEVCGEISEAFSEVEQGEALWFPGHIGIYIGDGWAVECTHRWADGVQVTAVHNLRPAEDGVPGRLWTKHGKLPYVTYEEETPADTAEETKAAQDASFIRQVQSAIGAAVDGVAGPETLGKTVTVSQYTNSRHPVVKAVQKQLAALGYSQVGTADGIAGPKFAAAVKAYQQDHGCVTDGIITAGNKTWKSLLGIL